MPETFYPEYEQIQLNDYELIDGYYTLGFLKKIRPDCVFITPDQWQDYHNYEWLDELIRHGLDQGKTVCIVPWDENILNPVVPSFAKVLNCYVNHPVWLITQLDNLRQKIYSFQHGICCKMLEVPWWSLNDCLSYKQVSKRVQEVIKNQPNFLCLLGRYDQHKFDLAKELQQHDLDQFGLITVANPKRYPKEAMSFCQSNVMPYQNLLKPWGQIVTQQRDTIWISASVKNFLYIEDHYSHIPLVVHPETTCGIFFTTEKSLWPLLLGKLMLVYGQPGIMNGMQRFYDVDFSLYADLEFDQDIDDWTEQGHRRRLKLLVERNKKLIQNCKEIHDELRPQLESARWTLGKRIYDFTVQQLKKI